MARPGLIHRPKAIHVEFFYASRIASTELAVLRLKGRLPPWQAYLAKSASRYIGEQLPIVAARCASLRHV